jgi:glycerol-3-phosphate dehydrogenase
VIFLLPWEGSTVVGTTDAVAPISALPRPYEHEIQFILKEVSQFLTHEVKREDVDAAWAGIRPLAKDVHAKDTASTSRDHVVESTRPGMVTIAGGKWTTYRKMAEDAVDAVLRENKALSAKAKTNPALERFVIDTTKVGESNTLGVPLIGAAGWSLQLPTTLHRLGFDKDIAQHLSHNYGDKSFDISKLIQREKSLTKRLANGYPFIEAEVVYAARYEHALTATDMIANRIRLAFLNSDASYHALPRVINLMARELGWDTSRKIVEYRHASKFLSTMNRKGKNPLAYSDPLKMQETENRVSGEDGGNRSTQRRQGGRH